MAGVRHRTSRWAPAALPSGQAPIIDVNGTPLPTTIHSNMTAEQLDTYVTHFRVQEISNQLRLPDTVSAQTHQPTHREPSPDPEYDARGYRTNTRPQRRRRALESERHRLIDDVLAKFPSYQPPHDYRRPARFADHVYIPQNDFPAINFIGQILGPRGSSLKAMQDRTGATLAIRGKGSVKEGRGHRARASFDNNNQPLHVLVTADSQSKVDAGKMLTQQIMDEAALTPEWKNEHKKKQLRDLAVMNGTF